MNDARKIATEILMKNFPDIRKSTLDMPLLFKQGVNCYYNRQRFKELLWKYRNIQKPKADRHAVESKKGSKHRI